MINVGREDGHTTINVAANERIGRYELRRGILGKTRHTAVLQKVYELNFV